MRFACGVFVRLDVWMFDLRGRDVVEALCQVKR
jgi:hypothetical protein